MTKAETLKNKIKDKSCRVCVVGLGYVGLPIALEFASRGFPVIGLDNNPKRIESLIAGVSHISDIPDSSIKSALDEGNFEVTGEMDALSRADAVILCVPTPLRKVKEPDISYVIDIGRKMTGTMRSGQLVILESTTYPGTTREVILPLLEESGLKAGVDFFLAFSPERIDPGNPSYGLANIPKLVGGNTPEATELGKLLYSQIIDNVLGLSSPESAEVTKLLENTFRIVNIALINEFAHLCHRMGIDVWEVIEAASTKPFGFMPFYPGPGIGGHCIPTDPLYLSWKARKIGFRTRMIDLAAGLNRRMPEYIVSRTREILSEEKKALKGSRVLVLGVTYKKDVNDLRESPAIDIIKNLESSGAAWSYSDPLIPYLDVHGVSSESRELSPAMLERQDLVILIADHSAFDYDMLKTHSRKLFDTRNAFESKGLGGKNIIKL